MAKRESEREEDQREKSATQGVKSAGQSSADEEDVSCQAPSRVHIFKGKPSTAGPAKSGDERLKFSPMGTNIPIAPPCRTGQAALAVRPIQPPAIHLMEDLARLRQRIEKGKRTVYEAAMKIEDLEALIQGLQRTGERIFQRRK